MKSFLVSFLSLILLLGIWGFYTNYSDKEIHQFIDSVENSILIDVENANWEQAEDKFNQLEKNWHEYKKVACFFFSTDKINSVDYTIARSKYYIKCKDDSNSSGELSCLKEQFKFLHENESVSFSNIL
ncbi:MAG: DUF4363 family protein [Aminipila sp.]